MIALLFSALAAKPQWIWAEGSPLPSHVYFRRDFTLANKPQTAKLSITCDDSYELTINGKAVAHNALWYTMQDLNVAPYLKTGANVIAVEAHNVDGPAGLLVEGSGFDSNADWKASTSPFAGWKSVNFDDSSWMAAKSEGEVGVQPWGIPGHDSTLLHEITSLPFVSPIKSGNAGPFSPDPARNFKWMPSRTGSKGRFEQMAILPSRSIKGTTITAPKTIRLDFGRELSGTVQFTVTAAESPDIQIQLGEASSPQSQFQTVARHVGDRWTYTMLPTGGFTGFRYAWIHFNKVPSPIKVQSAKAFYRIFPANYLGSFRCSDTLLNRIWEDGAYTVRLNLDPKALGAILKPERGDRFPWMGDDRVAHHALYDVFGDYELAKSDLDFFVKPGDKNINVNGIPGYTLDWVIGLYDYWMVSGDREEVKKHEGDIKTILQQYDTTATPAGWLFTDWEPGAVGDGPESLISFRIKYVEAAKKAVALATAVGNRDDATLFKALAEKRASDLKAEGWPDQLTTHEQADAVLAGLNLSYPAQLQGYTYTPYFTYYVLEALSQTDQDARALRTIREDWGGMVKLGGTSTWEYFRPQWAKTLQPNSQPPAVSNPSVGPFISLCHPWSAGATAWLSDHVLGATPLSPGYRKCQIKPFVGDLKWASGAVPTPRGLIAVQWKKVGAKLNLSFKAPSSTQIVLELPEGHYSVDGKKGTGHSWTFVDAKKHSVKSL